MGQGIYSQCTNNYGTQFTGTVVGDQCMYDLQNLATLPEGTSSFYVEAKNSGGCFFDPSFFVEGYALPGSPAGSYNVVIGYGSPSSSPFYIPPPWSMQTAGDGQGNTAYLWVLPGGIPAAITSFEPCGDQSCFVWTIEPGPAGEGQVAGPPASAPFSFPPEEGSDYQGDPGGPRTG
jgi:hypothetical protein